MSSLPLTKTSKSNIPAEQPSKKKIGTYKKDILHPKAKKKPQGDGRRGTLVI